MNWNGNGIPATSDRQRAKDRRKIESSYMLSKKRKILLANVPIDGHFNPLTDLAVYLKNQGHDVRWYAGNAFDKKLQQLNIPRFPFKAAKEINQFNIDQFYPERLQIKSGLKKLQFDLKYFFV